MESPPYLCSFPRMKRKSPVGRKQKRKYFWIQTVKRFPRRTLSRSSSMCLSEFCLLQMHFVRVALYGFSFREVGLRKEADLTPVLRSKRRRLRSPECPAARLPPSALPHFMTSSLPGSSCVTRFRPTWNLPLQLAAFPAFLNGAKARPEPQVRNVLVAAAARPPTPPAQPLKHPGTPCSVPRPECPAPCLTLLELYISGLPSSLPV